jgi:hypothetical protein
MQAYFNKDYAGAADNLDRAYRLFSTPTLGLWSGRALIETGQWVRAAERLREAQFASAAIGDNAAQRQAQSDATDELKALEPRIPRVTVTVTGAPSVDVALSIDLIPVAKELFGIAHAIDPGHHSIVGLYRAQRIEVEINLEPGQSQVARVFFEPEPGDASTQLAPTSPAPRVTPADIEPKGPSLLRAEPEPEAKPNLMRIAAISSLSLGGAALATSLVLTWLAADKLSDCTKRAGEYYCSDREADAYESYRGVATATFYAGSALAGAGLALWLLQPSTDQQPQLSLSATPLGAALSGKF